MMAFLWIASYFAIKTTDQRSIFNSHQRVLTFTAVEERSQLKLEICQTLGVNTSAEPSSRFPECRTSVVSVNPSNDNHARIVHNLLDYINHLIDGSWVGYEEYRDFTESLDSSNLSWQRKRYLMDEVGVGELSTRAIWLNLLMSLVCVCVAALAAGLTMGMLSIEPLSLMIKMRCGTAKEISQAGAILPLIRQRHLLLVTLLLLNSISNEALPLFLDQLVPSYAAVLISVTMVLIFGEIVPSAIFTGPDQISMAAAMSPLVKLVTMLLMPVAWPIAKLLDFFLGHDESIANTYGRGEISALVRILHEEQRREKQNILEKSLALAKRFGIKPTQSSIDQFSEDVKDLTKPPSFHDDEVTMIEGAMQMRVKTAKDIFTPLSKVSAVEKDIILDDNAIASIYASGHSRIPVYQCTYDSRGKATKDVSSITGILLTRQLIVIDADDKRPLSTLPLVLPQCVSPFISLVDLLNIFQERCSWRTCHLAVVCELPALASIALDQGLPIPKDAKVLGIVTMEDVIEQLIKENILDEFDRDEVIDARRARIAYQKWKKFVENKRRDAPRSSLETTSDLASSTTPLIGSTIESHGTFIGMQAVPGSI